MTTQNELDAMVKEALKKECGYLLAEELKEKHFRRFTMHQIRQSLNRLSTEGIVVSRVGDDGAFKSYSYNPLYDGSRLINRIWRKR